MVNEKQVDVYDVDKAIISNIRMFQVILFLVVLTLLCNTITILMMRVDINKVKSAITPVTSNSYDKYIGESVYIPDVDESGVIIAAHGCILTVDTGERHVARNIGMLKIQGKAK